MNTAPQVGQAGQPGQGGVPAGAAQSRPQLFRPEMIERISWLTAEEKAKYTAALRTLWHNVESVPKGSQEHATAQRQIINISRSLLQRNAQVAAQRKQQAVQQAQQGQQPQQRPQQGQQQPQANAMASAPGAGNIGNAGQAAVAAGGIAAASTGAAAAANAAQRPQQPPTQLPEHIRKHISEMEFLAPPSIAQKGELEAKRFIENFKRGYVRALLQMDGAKTQLGRIDQMLNQPGRQLTADEQRILAAKRVAEAKKYDDNHKAVEQFRRNLETFKGQQNAKSQPGGVGATSSGAPAAQTLNSDQSAAAGNEAAKGPQGPAPGGARSGINNANATGPRQVPGQGAVGGVAGAGGQPPQRVTKIDPPVPPPVNTQVASAHHPSTAGTPTQNSAQVRTPATATGFGPNPSAQTPATPATATQPQGPGAGQPKHSFTSAVSMASQNQSTPQGATTTPSSSGVAGVIGAAPNPQQPGHPHAHPQQSSNATMPPKMPINKNLPEAATRPPPQVPVGQSRPSITGGTGTPAGALGQPANPKIQPYQHQDEGEHVLSKKRLDDLVRQVCGGTADGQPANLLTADVEENILLLVDNMVENTLNIAARFAKERGSKVLEIRDIQLVLERVYNIRVPGYSSDELRTVRRIQPSQAWVNKMSMLQASKVTGKGD